VFPYRLGTRARTRSTDRSIRLEPIDSDHLETVLTTSKDIAGTSYRVQITTNHKHLKIDVRESDSSTFQALELPYAEAFELMNAKDDYGSLVALL
jgi:hypothetical protein